MLRLFQLVSMVIVTKHYGIFAPKLSVNRTPTFDEFCRKQDN